MDYQKKDIQIYEEYLKNIALLSRLFSESDTPYLHYRTTEYLYCRLFNAKNISRSDVTIDAEKNNIGIGIKTFTYNGKKSLEKIAEFNGATNLYKDLPDLDKVKVISRLRNKRIELVERDFNVNETIYHCIGRKNGKIFVFEIPMNRIEVENIRITSNNKSSNVINFTDEIEQYSFNISKSTLYKYFEATEKNTLLTFNVDLLADPLESIKKLMTDGKISSTTNEKRVVLPLYSTKNGNNFIYEKSGLNHWMASAEKRKRNYGEVEIGIRTDFRDLVHSVLPKQDTPFEAIRPNGDPITLKVSQQDGKALMSNPQSELGTWLLGNVLGLPEGSPVTYEQLVEIGIDSIELTNTNGKWYIDYCKLGSFEKFLEENS